MGLDGILQTFFLPWFILKAALLGIIKLAFYLIHYREYKIQQQFPYKMAHPQAEI
mgnify:CR=1 FL=1